MFLPELLSPDANDTGKRHAEAYQRLISPLFMLSFGLLAALILIYAPESRLGRQKAIGATVLLAFCIELSALLCIQTTALGLFGFYLALLITILPLMVGGILSLKIRNNFKTLSTMKEH